MPEVAAVPAGFVEPASAGVLPPTGLMLTGALEVIVSDQKRLHHPTGQQGEGVERRVAQRRRARHEQPVSILAERHEAERLHFIGAQATRRGACRGVTGGKERR